ncbi:MAG: hypothetical protein IPL49_18100 [Saprospirales bacterium]|nr:hypothetical protein [Saprospirales bacterium]
MHLEVGTIKYVRFGGEGEEVGAQNFAPSEEVKRMRDAEKAPVGAIPLLISTQFFSDCLLVCFDIFQAFLPKRLCDLIIPENIVGGKVEGLLLGAPKILRFREIRPTCSTNSSVFSAPMLCRSSTSTPNSEKPRGLDHRDQACFFHCRFKFPH